MHRTLALLAVPLAACSSQPEPSDDGSEGVLGGGSSTTEVSSGAPAAPASQPTSEAVGPSIGPSNVEPGPEPGVALPTGGTTTPAVPGNSNAGAGGTSASGDPVPAPTTPALGAGGAGGNPNDEPTPVASGGAGGEGLDMPGPADGGAAGEQGVGGGTQDPTDGACSPPTEYRNLFAELLDVSQQEVDAKVEAGFNQLFHGGGNQNVYYESGDEGYILDVASNDVRSEGQSYGMMIALQLDKKQEFDAIWRWSKRVMQQPSGTFGWHATTSGQLLSNGSAPDGEEYFATALIFASHRWGDDTGIDYMAEAQRVLGAMYDQELFNHQHQLVKFVQTSDYTDPSYILPTFYEVWACDDEDQERAEFWKAAADTGRAFFPTTCHPDTGLAPYLANWDGSARADFNSDSYRVVGNIMMDHHLYGVDPWQETFAEAYAAFFEVNQQSGRPGAEFRLDGTATVSYGQPEAALAAMNAMVAFGVPAERGRYFVEYLWDMPVPTGQYRYYAGMLYMLSLVHVSGKFHLHF